MMLFSGIFPSSPRSPFSHNLFFKKPLPFSLTPDAIPITPPSPSFTDLALAFARSATARLLHLVPHADQNPSVRDDPRQLPFLQQRPRPRAPYGAHRRRPDGHGREGGRARRDRSEQGVGVEPDDRGWREPYGASALHLNSPPVSFVHRMKRLVADGLRSRRARCRLIPGHWSYASESLLLPPQTNQARHGQSRSPAGSSAGWGHRADRHDVARTRRSSSG